MSYYNPLPNTYNVQSILESISGSQIYSPQKSYAAPPISNQYRQSGIGNVEIGRQSQTQMPFNAYNSRSAQSFIPISSMQDNRDYLKPNLTSSTYAAPQTGYKPSIQRSQYENDNIYINPPPLQNQKVSFGVNASYSQSRYASQISPAYNKYSKQEFDNDRYPYTEDKKISQYVGSYVNDPSNYASQPIQYNKQFDTKKFESNINLSQYGGVTNSRLDTLQSRIIKEDPIYTRSFVQAEPSDHLRQSFGNPSQQFPTHPNYIMSGVGDSVLSQKPMGDLPTCNVKRDQNFYYDSYITINGLGTYKKYPLKIRKGANSVQQQESQDNYISNKAQENNKNNIDKKQSKTNEEPLQKNEFMLALLEISKAEVEIENTKTQLINQQDYNIPSFFQFFDKNSSSRISMFEFQQGQKAIGLNLSQLQLSLIFTRIFPNASGLITYENFEQMCLPLLNNDVGKYVTSKRNFERNINEKTIDLFRRLLHYVYESEQLIDNLRKKLFKTLSRVDQFYRELNSDRNGRITISELESGLLKYSDNLSAYQVAVLFYRMCQNKSTYLTFDQFERFCYGGEEGRQQFLSDTSRTNAESSSYNQFKYTLTDRPKRNDFKKIVDKLIANTNLEVDIESIQNYLITKRDLKLHNLFSMFRPQKNFVDVYAFTEALKNIFKIPLVDFTDISLLFRKIKNSNSQPDLIDFSEFCNLIIPKDTQPPRDLFDQDRAGDLEFYSETQTFLQKLFKAHLNNEVIFNEVRLEIQTKSLNIQEIFDFFCQGKPYLEKQDFDKILKENGSPHPTRYHNLIFTRFDPKQEGITNFTYFSHTLKI